MALGIFSVHGKNCYRLCKYRRKINNSYQYLIILAATEIPFREKTLLYFL